MSSDFKTRESMGRHILAITTEVRSRQLKMNVQLEQLLKETVDSAAPEKAYANRPDKAAHDAVQNARDRLRAAQMKMEQTNDLITRRLRELAELQYQYINHQP